MMNFRDKYYLYIRGCRHSLGPLNWIPQERSGATTEIFGMILVDGRSRSQAFNAPLSTTKPCSQVIINLPTRPRDIPLAPKIRRRVPLVRQPRELADRAGVADAHTGACRVRGPSHDTALIAVVGGRDAVLEAEVAKVAAAFEGAADGVEVEALVVGVGDGDVVVGVAEGEGGDADGDGGCAGCGEREDC